MTTDYVQPELPFDMCTAFTVLGICGDRAVASVTMRCGHGHIREGYQCQMHMHLHEVAFCRPCAFEQDHECQLTLVSVHGVAS